MKTKLIAALEAAIAAAASDGATLAAAGRSAHKEIALSYVTAALDALTHLKARLEDTN